MSLLPGRVRMLITVLLLPMLVGSMLMAPAWAEEPAPRPEPPEQVVRVWVNRGLADKSEAPWLVEKVRNLSKEGVEKLRDALGSRRMDRQAARQSSDYNSPSDLGFSVCLGLGGVAGGAAALGLLYYTKSVHPLAQFACLASSFGGLLAGGFGYQALVAKLADNKVVAQYRTRIDELAARYPKGREGQDPFYTTVDGNAAFNPGTTLSLDRSELVTRADKALQVALAARQSNNHELFIDEERAHYAQNDYMTAVECLLRKDLLAMKTESDPDRLLKIYQDTLALLNARYDGIDFPAGHRWQLHRRLAIAAAAEVQSTIDAARAQLNEAKTDEARTQIQERISRLFNTQQIVRQYPPNPPGPSVTIQILGSRRTAGSPTRTTGLSGTGDGNRAATGSSTSGTGSGGTGSGGTGRSGTGSGDSTDPLNHNDINRR
jgi:uncharacterized membrane protein YgcG